MKGEKEIWTDNIFSKNKESKVLWAQLQEAPVHKIEYNPAEYTLEQIQKDIETVAEYEKKKRERMDKEYTDIADVKNSEIDELRKTYGENPPAGMKVKLKVGGMYGEYPLQFLYTLQDTIKKEYERRKETSTK